jgi:hypothetical protein
LLVDVHGVPVASEIVVSRSAPIFTNMHGVHNTPFLPELPRAIVPVTGFPAVLHCDVQRWSR